MSAVTVQEQVTLAREAIHNPAEPRHFMRIKPVRGSVRVLCNGQVLAQSQRALRLLEAGKDLYDPVLYFAREDVTGRLQRAERRTHCPLKGDASYYDLCDENGVVAVPEIAWSYENTFDFAAELTDLIAFDASKVVLEEHPG